MFSLHSGPRVVGPVPLGSLLLRPRVLLKQTQDLLRHRLPDGDLAAVLEGRARFADSESDEGKICRGRCLSSAAPASAHPERLHPCQRGVHKIDGVTTNISVASPVNSVWLQIASPFRRVGTPSKQEGILAQKQTPMYLDSDAVASVSVPDEASNSRHRRTSGSRRRPRKRACGQTPGALGR